MREDRGNHAGGKGKKDPQVEPPLSLLCEVTYRCPLQCPYCSNPVDFALTGRELTTEQWKSVLRQAAELGVIQVHFSGGEPLLRRDLLQLIALAHELGLYTNISTGGTLLTPALVRGLKEAGLDSIQLSFQGAEPELADRVSGHRGACAKKLEAAAWIHEVGLPLTVNVVLHRQNLDQIREILELAQGLGAERLELANTQYYGWAWLNRKSLLPTRSQVERATRIVKEAIEELRGKMEILWVLPDYYEPYPKPCLGGWARLFLTVTADGVVLPCQVARGLPGLRFPSVRERTLAEIWFDSEAFQKFRGTDWMPEPCRSCPRRTIDFGGCRCQAFLWTGDPARTDPVCVFSPDHHLIQKALEEAEEEASTPWTYRNPVESRRLGAALKTAGLPIAEEGNGCRGKQTQEKGKYC
jgi:pyrroloquinoline quinone biosynthesis protein E